MSDPQNFGHTSGLGELGQRVQALSDPAPEPRLRPYQGAPLPVGTVSNGRPIPSYEVHEDVKPAPTPAPAATQYTSPFTPLHPDGIPAPFPDSIPASFLGHFTATPAPVAAPEPYVPLTNPASNGASASNGAGQLGQFGPLGPLGPVTPAQPTAPIVPVEPVDPNAPKSGFQRAVDAVRTALPLVQRLLPLLDGNFANVLSSLVGPQPAHQAPAPKVDLEPVERGLADVRTGHRELRATIQEQATTLKRVEDHLERVREATDRNTLEQQELMEDLRSVGNRISTFAIVGILLLAISLGLNIYFLIQLQHILR